MATKWKKRGKLSHLTKKQLQQRLNRYRSVRTAANGLKVSPRFLYSLKHDHGFRLPVSHRVAYLKDRYAKSRIRKCSNYKEVAELYGFASYKAGKKICIRFNAEPTRKPNIAKRRAKFLLSHQHWSYQRLADHYGVCINNIVRSYRQLKVMKTPLGAGGRKKPVLQYKNGRKIKEFPCTKCAADELGLNPPCIFSAASGWTHSSGGYEWRWKV